METGLVVRRANIWCFFLRFFLTSDLILHPKTIKLHWILQFVVASFVSIAVAVSFFFFWNFDFVVFVCSG